MGSLMNLARRAEYRLEERYRPAIQHRCETDFIGSVAKTERTIDLLNQHGFQLFWVSLRSDVFSFIRTGAPHIQ